MDSIRRVDGDEVDGQSVVADGTVSSLPQQLAIQYRAAGPDRANQPLQLVYDASSRTDVTGRVEMHEAGADKGCGGRGVTCADVSITNLPIHVDTRVSEVYTDLSDGQRERNLKVDIDAGDIGGFVLDAGPGPTSPPTSPSARRWPTARSPRRYSSKVC